MHISTNTYSTNEANSTIGLIYCYIQLAFSLEYNPLNKKLEGFSKVPSFSVAT
jgi:hypothetical protein